MTIPKVNAELARRGIEATLVNARGYFYFKGPEPSGWLDRTVRVKRICELTLQQWVGEYDRLRKMNREILRAPRKR